MTLGHTKERLAAGLAAVALAVVFTGIGTAVAQVPTPCAQCIQVPPPPGPALPGDVAAFAISGLDYNMGSTGQTPTPNPAGTGTPTGSPTPKTATPPPTQTTTQTPPPTQTTTPTPPTPTATQTPPPSQSATPTEPPSTTQPTKPNSGGAQPPNVGNAGPTTQVGHDATAFFTLGAALLVLSALTVVAEHKRRSAKK